MIWTSDIWPAPWETSALNTPLLRPQLELSKTKTVQIAWGYYTNTVKDINKMILPFTKINSELLVLGEKPFSRKSLVIKLMNRIRKRSPQLHILNTINCSQSQFQVNESTTATTAILCHNTSLCYHRNPLLSNGRKQYADKWSRHVAH